MFEILFAPKGAFLPPMNEIYHYPLLCVGWFGLLITAINLIPVGQLDGGHISRALFGEQTQKIKQIALTCLILLGLAGFLPLLGVDFEYGYTGWLFWAGVLLLLEKVFRSGKVPLMDDSPLDSTRIVIGWICFLIFAGSISLTPFSFVIP
jgi:membrane-associated protease RseP (regulator of RpoE activity)